MGRLLRNSGVQINPALTDFRAKAIDDTSILAHKLDAMIFATTKTTTKTKPSGGSGGVRA
jgi:hypothetical protein